MSDTPRPGADAGLVFVVDDDVSIRLLVQLALEQAGHRVEVFGDGESCLEGLSRALPDAVCLDLGLPGAGGLATLERIKAHHPALPVVILTATSSVDTVVAAMRGGAYDYLTKPIDTPKLRTTMRNAVESHRMSMRLAQLEREAEGRGYPGIVGESAVMRELFRRMDRAAQGDVTVLIQGESGTGKELVARAIHEHGGRRGGPFVAINCAAIPEGLLESELFGHEKGAFTGAVGKRIGCFEQADGGTLFLDEVGELSQPLQAKLLRVLQYRTFQRVGGTTEVRSDFRLLAATHRDLAADVREGRFREDLFYRLAVFEIPVPPLRARREDVPLLARSFLAVLASRRGGRDVALSRASLDVLLAYPWPGNVRELQNALEQAAFLSTGPEIEPQDLPVRLRPAAALAPEPSRIAEGGLTLRDMEKRAIEEALVRHDGNMTRAAKALGMGRATLYRKAKEFDLSKDLSKDG